MNEFSTAQRLLKQLKGENYFFGAHITDSIPVDFYPQGQTIAVIRSTYPGSDQHIAHYLEQLSQQNTIVAVIHGPKPNAPLDDLARIAAALNAAQPTFLVSFGGGSTTDAAKAANVLFSLGGSIDNYFGTGEVTKVINDGGKKLLPHLAIQTAASSSAHLTKYANITNMETHQKKLIVDEAIIPRKAIFDYAATFNSPDTLTIDGALDGLSHALEVYYGAAKNPEAVFIETVALEAIRLIIHYLPLVIACPQDENARTGLALGTDLGGYAIMLGGTNGGHLTSFSLVDILSHGRACFMLNPYYTIYFSPAIQPQLRKLAQVFTAEGYQSSKVHNNPYELGCHVAQAMQCFMRVVGVPISLDHVPGFTPEHIERALSAAQNPQLRMKLENMPLPFDPEDVNIYMKAILLSAVNGDFTLIYSQFSQG